MVRFEPMVSKVEKPGLLSKVVRFVRNPVRDCSEIIQHHDTDSASKVKQAITLMLGRKRKNDVVRKLEFDQLRTLQKRTPHGQDDAFASSFFQTHASNMPSDAATPPSRAFAHTEPMPLPGDAVPDRYRSLGNSPGMQNQRQEFALYLEEQAGQEDQERHPSARPDHASSQSAGSVWVCPVRLSAADVPVLDVPVLDVPVLDVPVLDVPVLDVPVLDVPVLDVPTLHTGRNPSAMPCLLDWSALRETMADAVAPLDDWFVALCSQRVPVRFAGTGALLASLRSLTPTGKRGVEHRCWNLRLHVLCALGLQDEFDRVALDYCITYESAPAEWQDASCQIEQVSEPVLNLKTATGTSPEVK